MIIEIETKTPEASLKAQEAVRLLNQCALDRNITQIILRFRERSMEVILSERKLTVFRHLEKGSNNE